MTAAAEPGVWVFDGEGARFPAAVFGSVEKAEAWIEKHGLSGVLTWYPVDTPIYEWVMAKGYWEPRKHYQTTPGFIQKFSSAYTSHHHYIDGRLAGHETANESQPAD
ncbi:MAG TPA: hypothetical protein VH092_30985 [Urbifossiella sp.]|jgi:hypothetical protein|nr:hypothetical protein [Urbifossiella sp.]